MVSGICYGLQRRLLLWRRRGWEVVGDRVWENLGLYSGWMCTGCVAGLIASATHMLGEVQYHGSRAPVTRLQFYELRAASNRHSAAWCIFFPIQQLCVMYAMNILLRRVADHASHSYYNDARDQDNGRMPGQFDWRDCIGQYKLYYLVRWHSKLVMLLCAAMTVTRFVVAAFRAETAELYSETMAACAEHGADTDMSLLLFRTKVIPSFHHIDRSSAAARSIESAIFVIMAVGFLLFPPACIVMFRRVERRLDAIIQEMDHRTSIGNVFLPKEFSSAAEDGDQSQVEMSVVEARVYLGRLKFSAAAQRRQFFFCLAFVLLALVVLASLSLLVVYFTANTQFDNCSAPESCESCQTIPTLMFLWYRAVPELFVLVNSSCSTLPLLSSLWLMMTREDRALLLHPHRFRADAIALQASDRGTEAKLKAERLRMGIELR